MSYSSQEVFVDCAYFTTKNTSHFSNINVFSLNKVQTMWKNILQTFLGPFR